MQRYLSIVLDEKCNISHTLMFNDNYDLDQYIYNNFEDSEKIRTAFKSQIEDFLNSNKTLIHNVEDKNGKMYRGQIVILQVNEDGTLKRIKVIYKKDVEKIKNELLTNQQFMQKFVYDNRKYFPDFIYCKTRKLQSKTFYDNMMREFYKNIKTSTNFFEFCRSILKYAEFQKKKDADNLSEPSLTLRFSLNEHNNFEQDSYDPDLDFHPDLDDIERGKYFEDQEFISGFDLKEDIDYDKKNIKPKVKTYKKDPEQLSFFD